MKKSKTQINVWVGSELGEWLRNRAFELRISQAELVRSTLRLAKEETE